MNILDCTIRDGSYATHYHWDADALRQIVETLSAVGVEYIEIGNGTGLGAYRQIDGALSDEEYIKGCMPYRGESKIGAFFIPGTGTKDDLRKFREAGGEFIRIGANATEIEKTFEYVQYAKDLGYYVCCNLMKTYAISKFQLVQVTKGIVESGADCVYIVDSAGGMLPDQVKEYVDAIKSFYDIAVGFHGHNNLLMANANSLAALQSGADFADATLRGIGRGAGNAQLESLIAICQKAELMQKECNALELADLAEKVVGNMLLKGSTKREINVGVVNFHDSYTSILERVAAKYCIDSDELMAEVCKINIINPSEELFEFAARKLKEGEPLAFVPRYSHKHY